MTIELPPQIAAYFAADADKKNMAAVAYCFTEHAVVKDEGRTHTGRAAIQQWKEESASAYQYTSTPFASESADGKTVVTSHLVGNFPGSPIDLRFIFQLEGDKIAALEIVP